MNLVTYKVSHNYDKEAPWVSLVILDDKKKRLTIDLKKIYIQVILYRQSRLFLCIYEYICEYIYKYVATLNEKRNQ